MSPASAVITVEQRTVRSHVGWIENRHTVPLTAWSVTGARGSRRMTAIVPPAGRRWLDLGDATNPVPFRLEAVSFADGTFDGAREALLGPTDQLVPHEGLLEAVNLTTSLGLTYDVVAIIENRREVELEAWRFDWSGPDGRFRDRIGTDACGATGDQPGRGRIRPGERREVTVTHGAELPSSQVPKVRLSGALWTDDYLEGDPAWRDELMANRQDSAVDPAYWIPLLRKAAEMPGPDGLAFLRAERAQWLVRNPGQSSTTADNIELWARQVSAGSAIQLPVLFTGAAASLEQQRRQCGA